MSNNDKIIVNFRLMICKIKKNVEDDFT